MLTTIFLDVDNTILNFDKCSEDAMRKAMDAYGLCYKPFMFDVFRSTNILLWQMIERGELTVEGLFDIRWNTIFNKLGISGVDGRKFEEEFHRHIYVSAIKVDGADELLSYLHARYKLFVLSNAPAGQQQLRLKNAGLSGYIDGYFISEEMGLHKPDKQFFDKVFETLGIKKDEAIMIGDSPTADIAGAMRYGIKTIYFDFANTFEPVHADYTVTSLAQIIGIL